MDLGFLVADHWCRTLGPAEGQFRGLLGRIIAFFLTIDGFYVWSDEDVAAVLVLLTLCGWVGWDGRVEQWKEDVAGVRKLKLLVWNLVICRTLNVDLVPWHGDVLVVPIEDLGLIGTLHQGLVIVVKNFDLLSRNSRSLLVHMSVLGIELYIGSIEPSLILRKLRWTENFLSLLFIQLPKNSPERSLTYSHPVCQLDLLLLESPAPIRSHIRQSTLISLGLLLIIILLAIVCR